MQDAHEILSKINLFLKPISDLILYLFTSKTGFWILISAFTAYLLLPAIDAVRIRQLLHRAASSVGTGRMRMTSKLYIFSKSIVKSLTKIVTNGPVVIIVFIILFFIVGFSSGIQSIDNFITNQKKIQELKTVLKQIDKRYIVAEMEIINVDYVTSETTLQLSFFDYALNEYIEDKQKITLKGNDIYFDAIVLNFEYSQISESAKRNIVLPYRIFSNKLQASQGIILKSKDKEQIPFIFKRADKDIYGMTPEKYNENLKEFASILTDEKVAREAGVRSIIGNAVHKKVRAGQKLEIWVEQTGGIVIKEKKDF
ncbi:MAG: hypothetical protein GY756_20425 [bacterium]|nr:hypothetical protein [bacterium]